MHKVFGAILLVLGIFLLLQGHDQSRTFLAHLKSLAVGSPGARATYYLLGGTLCCAVGLVEFFRPEKK